MLILVLIYASLDLSLCPELSQTQVFLCLVWPALLSQLILFEFFEPVFLHFLLFAGVPCHCALRHALHLFVQQVYPPPGPLWPLELRYHQPLQIVNFGALHASF